MQKTAKNYLSSFVISLFTFFSAAANAVTEDQVQLAVVPSTTVQLGDDAYVELAQNGTIAISINFHQPVSALAEQNGAGQTGLSQLASSVSALQSNVLQQISTSDFAVTQRYSHIAGMAGRVNASGLIALSALPEIKSIYIDLETHATLAQAGPLINADDAHAAPHNFTGTGMRVAVLDTGIDTNHADLSDDLVAQRCEVVPTSSCPGGSASNAEDGQGHGTHVSGIVTGKGTVAPLGIAPDAEIIAVKVLDDSGSGFSSWTTAGLNWLVANHGTLSTDVVNMSLGGSIIYSTANTCDAADANALSVISTLRGLGVTVVAAAGNGGHTNGISSPACLTGVIGVGNSYDANVGGLSWGSGPLCTDSTTAADKVVCSSDRNALVDVFAPGALIVSASNAGGSTSKGGTSMSSPVTAGVAALVKQANSALTPNQIEITLETSTSASVNDVAGSGLSYPRVDALAAVSAVSGPGTLGFTTTQFNVFEDSGPAIISVARAGGSDGAVSVLVSSTPGSASNAGVDYTDITNQQLSWASGEAGTKTVQIVVNDDGLEEVGGETVNVTLSGVTGGASLGANPATLNINDADDGMMLLVIPAIMAAVVKKVVVPPPPPVVVNPRWYVTSTVCCPSSSATFSLTQSSNSRSSRVDSCSDSTLEFSSKVSSTPGSKSFSGLLSSSACGNFSYGFSFSFAQAKEYLFALEIGGSGPIINIYSVGISSSSNIAANQEFAGTSIQARIAEDNLQLEAQLPLEYESSPTSPEQFQSVN